VGDAAGYVEPFTGEGIGWALASGRILAAALLADAGIGGPLTAADVAAARYQQLHDRLFAPQHARCRRVARGVRHPAVVAGAVRLANALPRAAAWALPRVTGAAGRV
jgi:flavin-dependent dehydrogenase